MDAHEELLRAVYKHFLATAEWPALLPLQMQLRHLGHVPKLAAEIGGDKIHCDRSSAAGVCRLTLRGVALMDKRQREIGRFLFAVERLAEHYIKNGPERVRLFDLVAPLNLSDLEIRRLGELIQIAPGLWSGLGRDEAGFAVITPHDQVWYFEEVPSLEQFHALLDRAREDERSANEFRLPGYTPSPSALQRRKLLHSQEPATTIPAFVDEARLEELRSLSHPTFDVRRLIAMCEELNICAKNDCFHATAMLTRAIIDHVPPIFQARNFDEVANSYPGSKSFKASMQHLSKSARNIADAHLHVQIRSRETLPTATQVNFSRDLDVLLAEIVRNLT